MDPVLPLASRRLGVVVSRWSAGFMPLDYSVIGGILVSRIYNSLSESGAPSDYHAWVGINVLLLRVLAAAIFCRGWKPFLTGVSISEAIVATNSGFLRRTVLL
jgi:hypothetical protein